jgi:hypothetical protein
VASAASGRIRRSTNQTVSVFGLFLLEMHDHPVKVVAEPGRHFFTDPPDVVQKIVLHNVGFKSTSVPSAPRRAN